MSCFVLPHCPNDLMHWLSVGTFFSHQEYHHYGHMKWSIIKASSLFNFSEKCPCGNKKQINVVCTWDHDTISCYFPDNLSHYLVLLPIKLCVRGRIDADSICWGNLDVVGGY